jgi:hypothetical protein
MQGYNVRIPADTGNVTAAVTTPVAKASSVADAGPIKVGSVRLRGVSVSLDTDVGQTFVADCVRHTESLLSDGDIKSKCLCPGWVGGLAKSGP